jgi:uncharacterized peroxidase-related enzyme
MPHIDLPALPGITALMARRPDTARPLNQLAETLLRGPSPLSRAQRETIATHVSRGNQCSFCTQSHAAIARQLGAEEPDALLTALLAIADKVRVDGRSVTDDDIAAARRAGAGDEEIHDTVLIAAAFCMFNRYVDGLGTHAPADPAVYAEQGRIIAENGYYPGVLAGT